MKTKNFIIAEIIIVAIIIITLIFTSGPQQSKIKVKFNMPINEVTPNSRFEEVEEITFGKDKHGDIPGIIYRDKETGVKYIYIWFGMANGGPVFTRLWDK